MRAPRRGEPVRVLELRSVFGTGGGPEKTILLGAAGADPSRARVTVCYIRDARDATFHIDRRARELGVEYVEAIERHSLDLRVWGQLRAIIDRHDIHLVHSHEYKTDALAWLLGRRVGVRILSTAHGWTGHSARERRLYYPLNKRMLARFPAVIAVSGEIKRELLHYGAKSERVHVLHNGIDPSRFRRNASRRELERARWDLPSGVTAIGTVGRLEPQKRYDLLLEAFATVARTRPEVRLLIAGEGSERQTLEAHIGRLGLGDRCRLLGQVDDVAGLHHALDLFVQSSDYEGTPNVVLEAMALETPVVATDVGGTAEICEPGVHGLIVQCGSVALLSDAIDAALADPVGSAARVRSARQHIERDLSFEQRLRRLEALYERLAHEEAS
jgi:glycosyltransferase involved in cell wall biosynthesis